MHPQRGGAFGATRRAGGLRRAGAFVVAVVVAVLAGGTPVLLAHAPPVGAKRVAIGGDEYALHTAVTNLTLPFNLSGLPAISVPWKVSKDGVPICLQIIGRRGEDWRVLGVAGRLEKARR